MPLLVKLENIINMPKQRPSMADEINFPNKTKQFLAFVGVTGNQTDNAISPTQAQAVSLDLITLPPDQPRHFFDTEAMENLIASIQEHGILQPLLVRPLASNKYELIAGERRLRAAQILNLSEIPVVVRDLSDRDALQVSLLENLQREDLNPIEETEAILKLLSARLECSQEETISLLNLAANLQKQGSEFTNNVVRKQWETVEHIFSVVGRFTPDSFRSHRLPLLNLPEDILNALRQGRIHYTKARALAGLKDESQRLALLEEAIQNHLSVRDIKKFIQETQPSNTTNSVVHLGKRMKEASRRLQQSKILDDPVKARSLEALLKQIEKLLDC
jgi:ParB family transcriptional regulator, chromosome partitioning protein